jgi:ATP-binding cassette subfamily B protein
MAWGGGGGMFGGGGIGGPGPGGHVGNPGSGLPFAGIPSELQDGVEKLLATEPEWETPDPKFSHRVRETGVTLRKMLGAHKRMLTISIVLVVIEAAMLQAGPLLTKIGIDTGISESDWGVLLACAIASIVCVVITIVASKYRVSLTGKFSSRIMFELRVRVFAHLQRLSLDYYTDEKAGVIMTRMTSDVEALQQMLQEGLVQFAVQGLTMVVVTVILFFFSVKLALITLLLIVPALTVLSLWFRSSSDRGYNRVRDGIAGVLSDLSESLSGVRVVVGFNRMRHNVLNHRNVVGEYRDANDYTAGITATYGAGSEAIGLLGQATLLMIGGTMVQNGTLSVGELVAFLLYLNSFFQPIQQLVQQYNLYQQGQAAITKINELLTTTPSVQEADDAETLPPISGDLVLDGVTFGYDPKTPVLRDVDLHIAAGETMSFVGPTGAGKSTIAKLVTRFYDPTEGSVTIDGHDLRDVTIESLRKQLGVVPQEPFLFAGTMRDNVKFARPDATDEEIAEAVERVGLDELVARLPEGLDTPVHERGVSLSSGERQLIALARAFLAGPRVLVLDEATSNLDLKSETLVEAGLDAVLEGRTAIIVAHRLSTAMRADRIAVVDDGRIVELGSHQELVAAGGRYAEMYAAWTEHLAGHDDQADSDEMVGAPSTG